MKKNCIAPTILIFSFACCSLFGQGIKSEVAFKNTLDVPVNVYIKTQFSHAWHPPLRFKREQTKNFPLATSGQYYLLFQLEGYQLDLGWVDINYVVAKKPDVQLLVGTRTVTETYTVNVPYTENIEQQYTVAVPYTEMRIETYTVTLPNGKTETRTRQVPVTKTRTETRTRTVPVTRTRTEQRTRDRPVTGLLIQDGNDVKFFKDIVNELKAEDESTIVNLPAGGGQ